MNTMDKCKNCNGDRGLHHYETDQCPVGGREAPVNRKQEWKLTTFEKEDDSATQTATIRKLTAALEKTLNTLKIYSYQEYLNAHETIALLAEVSHE